MFLPATRPDFIRFGGMKQHPRNAILIVDDEPFVRLELSDMVRDMGFEPYEAANTAEALAIIQSAPGTFIALVTDIWMPGTRNGIVLANHVKYTWPDIRVIVMSAGRKPVVGELPYGTPFVAKPYSAPVMSGVILGEAAGPNTQHS